MAAYLLVTINLQNTDWLAEYRAHVPDLVSRHGGAYSLVSDAIKRHEGDGPDPDAIVLFTFPSMAAIDAFVSDPDYAPYRAARRAASTGDLLAFTPKE